MTLSPSIKINRARLFRFPSVHGRNPEIATLKPCLQPLCVGICRGVNMPGFPKGGAKWISQPYTEMNPLKPNIKKCLLQETSKVGSGDRDWKDQLGGWFFPLFSLASLHTSVRLSHQVTVHLVPSSHRQCPISHGQQVLPVFAKRKLPPKYYPLLW